jgi:predicted PurR-regulated permease PerM
MISLAGAVVVGVGMSAIRDVLAPVLLTLVLTICANPVRVALERRGVSHGLASGSVIITVFLLLAGLASAIIIALGQFVTLLPNYSTELAAVGATVASALASVGVDTEQIRLIGGAFEPSAMVGLATGLLGSVFSIVGGLVIVLTMLIVMSADAIYLPTVARQIGTQRPHLMDALRDYTKNVRRFMVVTTGLGFVQGLLCTIALLIIDVPAALLWGLLMFFCSYIPNLGYFIALVPPLFFGFLVGGWQTALVVLIVYAIINAIVQTVIQPRLVSSAVSISQTLTFFSVLLWASILGPLGAILAIPLTLLVRAILVDAHPEARLWRPAIGDISEAKEILKADSLAAKTQRREAKAAREAAKRP